MQNSRATRSYAPHDEERRLTYPAVAPLGPDHLAMSLREQLQNSLGDAYALEQELGGGGMSRVFVASETALGRQVVVKVLPGEMAGQLSVDRFKREISIAARLQHAHIVPLLTAGEVEGLPFFTMPFVEGESLRARLSREGELPLAEAVRMLREIASALAYAHAHNVVHRDIKPDNVLLSGGAAMVTDFGVAKALSAAGAVDGGGLTSVGIALGTPAYMAPEQATADPHTDHRADLYAWGMVAYELLTGHLPFAGRSPQALLAAQVTEVPDHLSKQRASISPALAAIVMRCLEKRPADRPQSADELVRALDAIVTPGGSAPSTARVGNEGTRPRGRQFTLAGVAALLLVVAGLWFVRRGGATAPAAPTELTLAVLPIVNIGRDSTTEYLADGMTGELAGALKRLPGVQVAGDLSTFRFKATHLDPADVARQLGVQMLLTGKLQSGTGRVRLQMQLSKADGKLLWSNTFDRENKDNFTLQDEITAAIAKELRLVFSPVTLAATRAGRTTNPEAHDLFMRGQFEKNKVTPQGLANALVYFQRALTLDPNYAQAYAGVAFVYDVQADIYAPSHEYHMLGFEAARRAVAADSLLAEGRVLHGFEQAAAHWDFEGGRAEMDRGLALNPSSPDALFICATFSYLSGDTKRAIGLAERLVQVDPLSPLAAHLLAETLLWDGRYEDALLQKRQANQLDPAVTLIDDTNGNALRALGRLDESLASFLENQKQFKAPLFGLPITYASMGRREDALREIHTLEAREKKQWVDPDIIAIAYAGIGDRDHAMEWLEKAFRMKTFGVRLFLNWEMPWLKNMRDDPRFIDLKKRVMATTFTS